MNLDHLVVKSLVDEAWGYHGEGRYGDMLRAARDATAQARRLGHLPLEVAAVDAEATAWRMLGQVDEALNRYTWIMGLVEDPVQAARMGDRDVSATVAGAYMEWVHCARFLPGMPIDRLFGVLDAGEAFLAAIGRPTWRAGLLHERARLLQAQGRLAQALPLAEEAVALEELGNDGPGYTLASYRWSLGDLYRELGRHAEAAEQYERVADDPTAAPHDRKAAHQGLGHCALADPLLGGAPIARYHAERAVHIAEIMGSDALCPALELLVSACRAAGDHEGARAAAERHLDHARRTTSRLRIYQALRDAVDVALDAGAVGDARRLLDEAAPLAARLDEDRGRAWFTDEVRRRRERLG